MMRHLGHRKSGMLKSYFVGHVLFKKWIYVVKNNFFKITPLSHISLFHIPNKYLCMNIVRQRVNTQVKLGYIASGNKCT